MPHKGKEMEKNKMPNNCLHESIVITDTYFMDCDGDYIEMELFVQCEKCNKVNRTIKAIKIETPVANDFEEE
jgi:hypothetical protein